MDYIRPTNPWFANHPRTIDYWKMVHKSINREPVREMDRYFMAMLKPLRIVALVP
jgi:hypothetical protein